MLKVPPETEAASGPAQPAPRRACAGHGRPRIALLSNPKSTGNIAQLPRIREYCDAHPDVFHYEVEQASQIGEAMKIIARVRPKVLAINGGDGTVQATLTELYNGGHFEGEPPPVAVLPSGKTNLIALDLGARGDAIATLEQLIALARSDELRATRSLASCWRCAGPGAEERPVIGMFLGGAGLADTMLYCRAQDLSAGPAEQRQPRPHLPRLCGAAALKLKASFLPPPPTATDLDMPTRDRISGKFAFLAVTTLEKLLLSNTIGGEGPRSAQSRRDRGERRDASFARCCRNTGGYKGKKMRGIHFEEVDEITIHGESSHLILDGETFRAEPGSPIHLTPRSRCRSSSSPHKACRCPSFEGSSPRN